MGCGEAWSVAAVGVGCTTGGVVCGGSLSGCSGGVSRKVRAIPEFGTEALVDGSFGPVVGGGMLANPPVLRCLASGSSSSVSDQI